jgi:hypothetical protein
MYKMIQGFKKMIKRWYGSPEGRRVVRAVVVSVGALLLYMVGLKLLLLPLLVVANTLLLPLPAIFKSMVSRLVVGGLVTTVLLQVAASLQFLLLPASGFRTLAVITWVLHIAVWLLAPVKKNIETRVWVTRHDIFALIVAGFFLLPFTPVILGGHGVQRIAQMGSVQAIDATNHYAGIAEMTDAEHLNYKPGYYYPKGFHIAQGFAQNTLFTKQYDLGWSGNAILYFAQYVVYGGLLAYMLYYLALAVYRHLDVRIRRNDGGLTGLWLSLTLAPTAAMFYLVPMVTEGFLNYYYVLATIIAGVIVLLGLYEKPAKDDLPPVARDATVRWGIFCYLLFIFGASVSWPLLIPPLVVIAALCILPSGLQPKAIIADVFHWRTLPIMLVFVLQLVPIYFQLAFAGSDGSQGSINAIGGLKEFHPYILLAGCAVIFGLVLRKSTDQAFKRALLNIFVPLAAFIALLILAQYYTVGEIRYYAIKSSILLEVLALAVASAALVHAYLQTNTQSTKYMLLLPAVPFVIVVALIGATANPLKPIRDLFREHSGQGYAAYFKQDVDHYVTLGEAGKIKHFNSTVLHYNKQQGKFYAHMQMPFWNNMMQYDSTQHDFDALQCVGALYSNIAFGSFTPAEQAVLVAKVKQCATAARHNRQDFYVLTDRDSAPIIKDTFGDLVKVVY